MRGTRFALLERSYRAAYRRLQGVFDHLPGPDGALRIRKTGNAHNLTLRAVDEARISLNNFITWGCAPDGYVDADSLLAESNRNTLEFVKRNVENGWAFLQTGMLERDMGDRAASDRNMHDAQRACEGARHFVDKVYSLIPGELESLQDGVEDLQAAIELSNLT